MKNLFKPERDVNFYNIEEIKYIASPLSANSYDVFNRLLDAYIDYNMKEHVKNKINQRNVDEDLEVKLRGVLEFKDWFNKIDSSKN